MQALNLPGQHKQTSNTSELKRVSSPLFRIIKNGKYGFIDQTGKIVIEPQFDLAWNFLALVYVGGKAGYINKVGQFIWYPTN